MAEEEEKEVQKKPKSKKLLIIIVLAVVLLGAGGGGVYYFKFAKPPEVQSDEKAVSDNFYEMETFTVNLADPGGKRFLKTTMKLRVSTSNAVEECKARNFELRDLVLTLLTGKESEEVVRPEDKLHLKKEIIASVNRALRKGQVQDVYFTEFLVQ
jgi:flagellar FliL protein